MHAILASMGTDGDVLPYVGLGAALRAGGHRVTLLASEHYSPLAARERLDFDPLFTRDEHEELLSNPDFWHPLKGGAIGARWGVRFFARQYAQFERLARQPDTILVTNPALLMARVVHDKLGTPIATMLLQPWMIASNTRPPVMPGGLTLPRWAPRLAKRLYWRGLDAFGDFLMARELNALRTSIDLPPVRRVLGQWWMSPQLILAMFPPWFGDPQPDWPDHVRMTGFPLYDGADHEGLPASVEAFLRSGDPPVAFTFGTGMMHAQKLYHQCIEACRTLGVRGVFVTKYPQQLPDPLPPFAMHVRFAPFRELFPRCAAVVHHGGVGTLSAALAAGVPQVVLPISWDQKDNAIRVRQLGAGDWVRPSRRNAAKIAKALAGVLTQEARQRPRQLSLHFGQDSPFDDAAQLLESLARGIPFGPHAAPRSPASRHERALA